MDTSAIPMTWLLDEESRWLRWMYVEEKLIA
jgi:hypothetical protein